METTYLICAVAGGTVLLAQTLLSLLGGMGHTDIHADDAVDSIADAHDSFLKLLSLKTIVAFITFFGLTGLSGRSAGWGGWTTLGIAIAAGVVALWIVAWLMSSLAHLQSRGNVDMNNAVGQPAQVYLPIPGQHKGHGKVLVTVQGRTVESRAQTSGPTLETGASAVVVAVHDDIVEVQRA
jgi:membrane protein implicated in regulation of membrane protease activity